MADDHLIELATRAFVYGYPLLYNLTEIGKLPAGTASLSYGKPVEWNTFWCATELLDPKAEFVSPNNDTLYLVAALDLSVGPIRLDVPGTHDRYYVLQCVDAWTNNFAYIGRRATGTAAQSFTFVPPGFTDEIDDGSTVVNVPSTVAVIVGRLAVDGLGDVPAATALQSQFVLKPPTGVDPAGIPEPADGVRDDLIWWERLRIALAAYPPPEGDAAFVATLEELGLLAGESPYVDPEPTLAEALTEGATAGREMIDHLAGGDATGGAWTSAKHYFDYNLDYFEVGTIDAPEWKIQDRSKAAVVRAVAARAGLWGNHGYEADYEMTHTDADGELLDGAHTYSVTFSPAPPVEAFWSITMYDVPRYYLVDNPINRYSLGDRSPGLRYEDDGSVTIYLQATSPGPEREANWLPTPAEGNFRPMLRCYQPGEAILDGTYPMPPIMRTDR